MPKEIKKHFRFMDLSYSATVDEVKEREKVMIKILRAKAIKKGTSQSVKIDKIVNSSNEILAYIEKNGVSNLKDSVFDTPKSAIWSQFIFLLAIILLLSMIIFSIV